MSLLTLIKPIIGKPDATEDVKIDNALTAIETWANGQIDSTNLKKEGVKGEDLLKETIEESKLAKVLAEKLLGKERVTEEDLAKAVQEKLNAKVEVAESYSAETARAAKTPFTPSTTKPTLVILRVQLVEESTITVKVGAVQIGLMRAEKPAVQIIMPFTFICPANKAWEWEKGLGASTVDSTYLTI